MNDVERVAVAISDANGSPNIEDLLIDAAAAMRETRLIDAEALRAENERLRGVSAHWPADWLTARAAQ